MGTETSHDGASIALFGGKGLPPYVELVGRQPFTDHPPHAQLRRFYVDGHPVFLTVVTHDRDPWLPERTAGECLFQSMQWAKGRYPFAHLAHVVLHDHMHWILRPEDGVSFSDIVSAVKRDVSWRLKSQGAKGPLWQKRFYDHVIRDEDDLARHLDYVHYSPVKHGYVARPAEYALSSFSEWVERDVYGLDWGTTEPERIKGMNVE